MKWRPRGASGHYAISGHGTISGTTTGSLACSLEREVVALSVAWGWWALQNQKPSQRSQWIRGIPRGGEAYTSRLTKPLSMKPTANDLSASCSDPRWDNLGNSPVPKPLHRCTQHHPSFSELKPLAEFLTMPASCGLLIKGLSGWRAGVKNKVIPARCCRVSLAFFKRVAYSSKP